MPWDVYGAGAAPWVSVDQGIVWLDDVLLRRRHRAV